MVDLIIGNYIIVSQIVSYFNLLINGYHADCNPDSMSE